MPPPKQALGWGAGETRDRHGGLEVIGKYIGNLWHLWWPYMGVRYMCPFNSLHVFRGCARHLLAAPALCCSCHRFAGSRRSLGFKDYAEIAAQLLPFVGTTCFSWKECVTSTSIAGWWFGTFFVVPYSGNNHPNWLIFFRGVETTNQIVLVS